MSHCPPGLAFIQPGLVNVVVRRLPAHRHQPYHPDSDEQAPDQAQGALSAG
jgi:hypothetical protein